MANPEIPYMVHIEWSSGHMNVDMSKIPFTSAFRSYYNKVLKICTNSEDVCDKLRSHISENVSTASASLPRCVSEYENAMNLYNTKMEEIRQRFRKGSRMYSASLKCANYYLDIAKTNKHLVTEYQRILKYGPGSLSLLDKIS